MEEDEDAVEVTRKVIAVAILHEVVQGRALAAANKGADRGAHPEDQTAEIHPTTMV